jgi:transcriptional regulator with XRE-family HTH domain
MDIPAGKYLKDLRERLGLGVRDVQEASALIAAGEKNHEFYLSAARLSQIENDNSVPSVFKLFSISAIYGVDFIDLLKRYGITPDRVHHYRDCVKVQATHPVTMEVHSLDTTVTLPVRLDPSFRWDTTQLLNRVVAQWGQVPAVLLQALNPRNQMYGYIGLSDYTMYPILRPGALVMIDGNRRRVMQTGWANEAERPIYFIELHDGYRCAWCQIDQSRLTLIPHPMSPMAAESFRYPDDAEVAGQVVGVAMRIVPAGPPS